MAHLHVHLFQCQAHVKKHGDPMADSLREAWENRKESDRDFGTIYERMNGKPKRWNAKLIVDYEVPPTLAAGDESIPIRLHDPFKLHYEELLSIGSFPTDYDFNNTKPNYYIGTVSYTHLTLPTICSV